MTKFACFTSLPPGKLFMLFCCLLSFADFVFKITHCFKKFFQGDRLSVTHIGSRSGLTFNVALGLIWVQIVCKMYQQTTLVGTVKPVSKRGQKIGFQDRLSLNAGQKYCRMLQGEHSSIVPTFIKLPFVIIILLSIFEWPLKTGFTVITCS